ncbi:MAG: hypothetical protein M0C28_22830 [Candidatus Moduliflexus flocculans]|nr:hypothetical protein [Candidatus Moduliflexus flocculans]
MVALAALGLDGLPLPAGGPRSPSGANPSYTFLGMNLLLACVPLAVAAVAGHPDADLGRRPWPNRPGLGLRRRIGCSSSRTPPTSSRISSTSRKRPGYAPIPSSGWGRGGCSGTTSS